MIETLDLFEEAAGELEKKNYDAPELEELGTLAKLTAYSVSVRAS